MPPKADTTIPPIPQGDGFNRFTLPTAPDVRRDEEYVVSAVGFQGIQIPQGLAWSFDTLTQQFGQRVYDSMMVDPTVSGCVDILCYGIMSNGMILTPAYQSNPNDTEIDPEAALSAEITESCARMLAAMEIPTEAVMWQMLRDALTHANKLAELIYRPIEFGEDKGKLGIKKIKTKPSTAWRYVVDSTGDTLAIQATTVINGALLCYPVEKFWTFAPLAKDGDPRGRSILRPVYDAWNFLLQLFPELYAAGKQFGSPSIIGVTAEGNTQLVLPEDANGNPIEGAPPLSPQKYLSSAIEKFIKNGGSLTVPHGTEIKALEPNCDGKLFDLLLRWTAKQIAFGILKSTRAVVEAEHGSKKDSDTQQDATGLVIRFFQGELCRSFRAQVVRRWVALNWGEEVAAKHTPGVSLGVTEHQDFAPNAGAIATLWTAGVLRESQRLWACQMLGIDPGDPARDAQAMRNTGEPIESDDDANDQEEDDEDNAGSSDPMDTPAPTKPTKGKTK